MKTTTKSALLLAAFIALPAAKASAETVPGWYAGLGAGANFQLSTDSDTNGVPSFRYSKPGLDIMGNLGYAYNNGLRVEAEGFHGYSVVKNNDGYMANTDFFANVLYDFNCPMVTPYVGAGIGVGFPSANNIGPIPVGSSSVAHANDSDVKLAYQGIVGVAVPVNNAWAVTADYRYIATLDPKYKDTAGNWDHMDNASHNIMVGVRYNFDVPAAVPAKMTEAPRVSQPKMASKAAVAPMPQTFEVFFDFDKADLTPEAKRIVAAAADEYKKGGYVRIAVTGHTDTMGSAQYNKGLSVRRADAVKAEFAKLGVDAGVVSASGVGENGLLVPTNDQVREAQNRRAEIVLGKK